MKKLTKVGILLLVMSLLVIYASAQNFQGSFAPSSVQSTYVRPNSTTYVSFILQNLTAVGFVYYTNGPAINFMLVNRSAFSAAEQSNQILVNGSLVSGGGVLEMAYNSVYGVFPYSQQFGPQQDIYASNSSPILPPGTYYAVFQNPGQLAVQVSYSEVLKPQSSINNTIYASAAYGITGAAMFFAGIVAILYSLIAKPKKYEENQDKEAEKMYAMERRTHRRKRRKTKR
jgi:hypothetical protein